jgi:putative MATE family efflux protein
MEQSIHKSTNLNKTILILTIPVIIEMLLETMIEYIDVSMIGRLGEGYLSATSISNSLIFTCLVLANAFSLGGTVMVTKFIGADDHMRRNKTIANTIIIGLIFAISFLFIFYFFSDFFLQLMNAKDTKEALVFTYAKEYMSVYVFAIPILMFRQMFVGILRGMGKTKVPMYLSGLSIILNVVLNTVMIYDQITVFGQTIPMLGLSIKGAALATLISRGVSLGILILYYVKIANFNIKRSDFILDREIMKGIFAIGVPTALEMMVFRFGMMYYLSMVTNLGAIASDAHSVANHAESISYTPGNAFNVVVVTLVGQFIGANRMDKALESIKKTDRMAILFMGMCGILFLTVPFLFIRLFTNNQDVLTLAVKVLRIQALAQVFFARYYVYSGVMRTIGKAKQIFFISASSVWIVRILLTYLLLTYTSLGLVGAWIPMCLDYVYRATWITFLTKKNLKSIINEKKPEPVQELLIA